MDSPAAVLPPHVLIFPFPAQGHINSMLKLAELLSHANLHITFLIPTYIHTSLLTHTNIQSRFNHYPGFQFKTLPENLYDGKLQTNEQMMEMHYSLRVIAKPFLRELLVSDPERVTCIIADGVLSFALDVAEEFCVPIMYFRTISACCFWAYFCIPQLVEAGELPFQGDDMDVPIANVKGMEGFLRRRDLPSICRVDDIRSNVFQLVLNESKQTTRAKALILNTFDDLERPTLSYIRTHCPKLYTIGPLHAHLKTRLASKTTSSSNSSNSLFEEDKSCIRWLDQQPVKSVLYVSFGSIALVTKDELFEFWHGLVNSGKRFLWVIRPDAMAEKYGKDQIPTELEEGTKERGYMVEWAPQEEVLAHSAIGVFLTHSGWNSTLESIFEGVPMICWPYFGDQQVNSRFVGEVWKLGLDMKDSCDRTIVEKMVKVVMEERRDQFMKSADQMAKLAREAVIEDGSSYCNLDCLIEDIRLTRGRG